MDPKEIYKKVFKKLSLAGLHSAYHPSEKSMEIAVKNWMKPYHGRWIDWSQVDAWIAGYINLWNGPLDFCKYDV